MFGKFVWTIFMLDEEWGDIKDRYLDIIHRVRVKEVFSVRLEHSSRHHSLSIGFVITNYTNSTNPKLSDLEVAFDYPRSVRLYRARRRFKHWLWEKREWWREKRGYYDKLPF